MDRGICVPGLVSEDAWKLPTPRHIVGVGTYYAEGIMERVAVNRGFDLGGYKDGIAMMSPTDLGATAWLRRPGHGWEGPFLVVDCSARKHIFVNAGVSGIVAEVGWKTAADWGMQGGIMGLEVYLGGRPPSASRATWYGAYWLNRVTFVMPEGNQ
jgi:hypothetical protein